MAHVLPVPSGASLTDVRGAIAMVISRHASLRSTVAVDGQGTPRQRVWSAAGPPAYEFGHFEDETGCRDWLRRELPVESSWPFRVGVIHSPTGMRLGIAVHHIAADLHGFRMLCEELHAIIWALANRVPPSLPPVRSQAADLAVAEQSPAGAAANKRATAHWLRHDNELGEILDDLRRRGAPHDSMHVASVYSTDAVQRIGALAGARVAVGAVAVAAIGCVLSKHLGRASIPMSVVVPNRHLPGLRHTVCSLAQGGLIAMQVPGPRDLEGAIPAALAGSVAAARYSHYDGDALSERMTAFDSGGRHTTAAPPSVNIMRTAIVTSDLSEQQELHDEQPSFTTWAGQVGRPCMGLNFHVRMSGSRLCFELRAGSHLVSAGDCRALVVDAMRLITD